MCEVCHEAWPLLSKGKKKSHICSKCSHHKNGRKVNLNVHVLNAYMKNFKTAKKAKETESEKLSRQEKQKQYMRRYRKRMKDNETEEGKQGQLKKQNVQVSKCRQKRPDNKLDEIKPVRKFATGQILDKPQHNVDKETYLSQFDSIKSGPIHVQKWAIKNMQDFHNSLKVALNSFQCLYFEGSL